MTDEKIIAGFVGAGGIARAHAFALNSVKYYYNDTPAIELEAVCSSTEKSRNLFAGRYGFKKAINTKEFFSDKIINTVFILGPNSVHAEHLEAAVKMPSVKKIYIEKPVCSTLEEENEIASITKRHPEIKIQVGFQFLFMTTVMEALKLWKSGKLGSPVHFELRYYHGDYLSKEYRDKRITRLTAAPDGGAMADLGSHAISLAIAFLGNNLHILNALQSWQFHDVLPESDLFSQISLFESNTGAVGTVSASRISSGTGDMLSMELYAERGSLRFSSQTPDYYEYFLEDSASWTRVPIGSNYKPLSSFPSGHVPAGWLRSMIHAHYVFITDNSKQTFIPDIYHGLEVQRIVRETAEHLKEFRKLK